MWCGGAVAKRSRRATERPLSADEEAPGHKLGTRFTVRAESKYIYIVAYASF